MVHRASKYKLLAVLIAAAAFLVPSYGFAHGQLSNSASPAHKSNILAQVKFIRHGLAVTPPKKKKQKGRVHMQLFSQYLLHTGKQELASIGFKDKTTLHLNQQTDAVLKSPHLTYVRGGEVNEALAPGANHRVQTAAAVASAIGTRFDVKVVKGGTYVTVVSGVVKVKNALGSVTVKPNQQTVIVNKQAPQPPTPVDATAATGWANSLPTPKLPVNVALDANGGKVVGYSSQYRSPEEGNLWEATYINDGRLDYGWESATDKVTDQWVKIELAGGKTYTVSEIIINPAATHQDPKASDLKNFEIRVSTTGKANADFTTVFDGTCAQKNKLQHFILPNPVQAKYVELFARDNYGSPDWTAVAELEVVAMPLS